MEGVTISPGYSYEKAPRQDVFLGRTQSKQLFREIFKRGRGKGWPLTDSQLFLDFLAGNQTYECTPWSTPTRNVFGWQKPCYLLVTEGYAPTFKALMEETCLGGVRHRAQSEMRQLHGALRIRRHRRQRRPRASAEGHEGRTARPSNRRSARAGAADPLHARVGRAYPSPCSQRSTDQGHQKRRCASRADARRRGSGAMLFALTLRRHAHLGWRFFSRRGSLGARANGSSRIPVGGAVPDLSDITALVPARDEAAPHRTDDRGPPAAGTGVCGSSWSTISPSMARVTSHGRRAASNARWSLAMPLPPGWVGQALGARARPRQRAHTADPSRRRRHRALPRRRCRRSPRGARRGDDREPRLAHGGARDAIGWEKLLVPAFVYFFKLLYPFRLANAAGPQRRRGRGRVRAGRHCDARTYRRLRRASRGADRRLHSLRGA